MTTTAGHHAGASWKRLSRPLEGRTRYTPPRMTQRCLQCGRRRSSSTRHSESTTAIDRQCKPQPSLIASSVASRGEIPIPLHNIPRAVCTCISPGVPPRHRAPVSPERRTCTPRCGVRRSRAGVRRPGVVDCNGAGRFTRTRPLTTLQTCRYESLNRNSAEVNARRVAEAPPGERTCAGVAVGHHCGK